MFAITKALIVDRPWIDLILSGEKIWEMRSTGTSVRGWFGLDITDPQHRVRYYGRLVNRMLQQGRVPQPSGGATGTW